MRTPPVLARGEAVVEIPARRLHGMRVMADGSCLVRLVVDEELAVAMVSAVDALKGKAA